MGLNELFYPKGIAVFGSVSPGKLGGILIQQILDGGFDHVYAVNPKGAGYKNVKGFFNVADITMIVDLALIASPAATVPQVLEDCGQAGIKAAIIISSGFSEAGNTDDEEAIKKIASKYDIRFIGPNCAGLLNTHWNLAPTLQAFPPKGSTAIISQSGAVGGAIMEWAKSQHLGISKFVSYGNGADLNQMDFLNYLKNDDETKVVGLYIENINNGRDFMQALKELTAKKPVVVIKSGRTATGQRAALSHTGSLAGEDSVYATAFKECGVIRVYSLDELIDLCKGFSYLPLINGKNVAIVTNSGGPGVMTADLAEELGLNVSEPSNKIKDELKSFLPGWAGIKNPIDLTVQGTGENYRRAIETMLLENDAALPIYFGPPYLDTLPVAEGFIQAFKNSEKAVVCAMETGLNVEKSIQLLMENGIPNFRSTESAIKVISYMSSYFEYRKKLEQKATPPKPETIPEVFVDNIPVLEPQAIEILVKNGIRVPRHLFVSDREKIAEACETIGYPVVLKVVSPKIIHKSDFGGVKVNIKNAEDALIAFDSIQTTAKDYEFRGVMIYPMLKSDHEVILGISIDKQFGPVIVFGMGGIYTEVIKDITLRIAPVSEDEAREMIKEIRGYRILKGIRGQKPSNLSALAKMISAFSLLPFKYPELKEADLNPVFVDTEDVVVGDVRLIF